MGPRVRLLAVFASVLLHAAALVLVFRQHVPASIAQAETIEISVQYVDPKPEPAGPREEARPAPTTSGPATESSLPSPPNVAAQRPAARAAPEEPRAAGADDSLDTAQAGAGRTATPGEAGTSAQLVAPGSPEPPRELDLGISSRTGSWAVGSGSGRGDGETWHNEPGGFPDPDAVKAAGAAQAK
ncbi:MAG: hypothetical protein HY901_20000, partial [Deltaproteobacteria bacterium]|nr:hypothetical protein [Deltaproteobacteria bacterium]